VSSGVGTLELRFLGEMEVARAGRTVELPPSKKTRGLLAYLALTGRSHRRERLCSLLWDVADDPRGALRWSLSRLRAIVDEPDRPRIRSPRDSVSFEADGARIDVLALKRSCAQGLDGVSVGDLVALAGEFRGELLEGLDLADFLDFQAWCVAEREETRKLHATVLSALIERLADDPETALPHARALATVDPLDETARARLVRLLTATGRPREAEQQYEAACRLLKELGRPGTGELEAAWRGRADRGAAPRRRAAEARPVETSSLRAGASMAGRRPERVRIEEVLSDTTTSRREHVLLVTGEPGLGKSRLLDDLRDRARERGGTVLEGRAFEAEAGRPFGPWIDALRQLPPTGVISALGADLGALLPELARDDGAPRSRDRLFEAVVELLDEHAREAPPVVLTLDDVQWLDAASAELLHYVARMSRSRPLLVALTARAGELSDNATAQRTVRGLQEMGLLEEVPLGPLGREEMRELLGALASEIDVERVFAESAGNPLFALEVARSVIEGDGPLPGSLTALIRRRVERLPSEAGDVLRWAAVLGTSFGVDRLNELMALDLDRLLASLALLERHALLCATGVPGQGAGTYAFSHDLVRRAIYSDLSQPRRRLMHLRVAERLGEVQAAETVAADLAHHAALAGESGLAARACAAAGRRFLRQFANEEARAIARRGRRHAADVVEPEHTRLLLELLQVEHQARRPDDVVGAASELEALAERALEQGSAEHARLGFHMLAYLHWEEGDFSDAQRQMMRAEVVSRAGDERAQVVAMAEAARCLVLLERELPRAEALALEASARSAHTGLRPAAIADAQGMLRQHQGRLDEAAELFGQARTEARRSGDAMEEYQALEHLVTLRQQQASWEEARHLARELDALAGKLREGSEAPFARALLALCGHALGEAGAPAALDAAVEELRLADAKLRLAYTLTRAARIDLVRREAGRARARAEEACRTAEAIGRPTETLLARVTLARARLALGEEGAVAGLVPDAAGAAPAGVAAFARREAEELIGALRGRAAEGATGRREEGRT
jgi:DNA-binding SARP family transcriptional activator/predicted ATPase